jgi:hypothetical protein
MFGLTIRRHRGAAVFEFHQQQELTPERLRQINRGQVALLATTFEELDIDPAIAHVEPMSAERRRGFLAIRAPRAVEIVRALRKKMRVRGFTRRDFAARSGAARAESNAKVLTGMPSDSNTRFK